MTLNKLALSIIVGSVMMTKLAAGGGTEPEFTGKAKACKEYMYKTGQCTAWPASWYQSCQEKTATIYGIKTTVQGEPWGGEYCGFLGQQMHCKVHVWNMGCGCNRPPPKDGKCDPRVDSGLIRIKDKQLIIDYKVNGKSILSNDPRRRAENPELGEFYEEVARAEHEDGEVIFDFNEYLTNLRQTNDFKDTQEFCALARESEVCDDPCHAVVADPVFQAYLPVAFGDGCAGKTKLSELCPNACNIEE